MFDFSNINSEYTFTQTDNRVSIKNITQALSSYLGQFGVSETDQSKDDSKTSEISNGKKVDKPDDFGKTKSEPTDEDSLDDDESFEIMLWQGFFNNFIFCVFSCGCWC